MRDQEQGAARGMLRHWGAVLAVLATTGAATAKAGSYELGDNTTLDTKLTLNYGLAVRIKNPSSELVNGPVEPIELVRNYNGMAISALHTGLPISANFDDGDRNFKSGSLINNRLSALAELQLTHDNYGLSVSGDGFYDDVYRRGNNQNDSVDTVNQTGPVNEFSDGTRYYDGQRFRLLDAYAYGSWSLGESAELTVRAGKHAVLWGESLFLSGVSSAQGTADATKAFVPGAEIKQILLPVKQVSFDMLLPANLTLLGYYKLDFKPNEIFPTGDYFSPADGVGPGAIFNYGSANPLYGGDCASPDALGQLSFLCKLNGIPGRILGAPKDILVFRGPDIRPSKWNQWGAGLKYPVTDGTTVGLYYLRYNDPNPSVQLNFGYPVIATQPRVLTTEVLGLRVPETYQVRYFSGINMLATSFSTTLFGLNVAGEVGYRDGLPISVQGLVAGDYAPFFVRGKQTQAQVSTIYAANPGLPFVDDISFVTETAYFHVNSTGQAPQDPGILQVGNGDTLFYNRNSWGFQSLAILTKRNVLPGWDASSPISYGGIVKGNPSMPGSFGALYAEGDFRLSVGYSMQYLQNLQVGVTYNFFFGDAGRRIGNTTLAANPYADRDYATFNVKYQF